MRLLVSALLLSFLTACQTTQHTNIGNVQGISFPAEKWVARTVTLEGRPRTLFFCPEARCGEFGFVMLTQVTHHDSSNVTAEDFLRMRSVNEAYLKEAFALLLKKNVLDPEKRAEVRSVRKINGNPVGLYVEGAGSGDQKRVFMAAELRAQGNRVAGAASYAFSSNAARRNIRYIDLPLLMNQGKP